MITGAFAASRGLQADNRIAFAIARVAFSAYEVGMFDIGWENAATTNDLVGDANSSLVNVIAPTAGGIVCGILGVWQQNVSAGHRGKILLYGETQCKIIKASGNVGRGDRLCATTGKYLSTDHAAGDRVIAVAREPLTAPSSATLGLVFFNGINGLAQFVT